jgi:hypothetical protein
MNNEKNSLEIKIYMQKMENIFNHVISMMEDNQKYVFSSACTSNLDLYFYYVNKINELRS